MATPTESNLEIIMADPRPGSGLQTLFAIFLGLMVTAFVGVGVYTFYPGPFDAFNERLESLNREREALEIGKSEADRTPEDRAAVQAVQDRINTAQDEMEVATRDWGRRTSIVLVIFATLAMAISLIRASQLPVISNGLLLGGVFTMLYGVGWIVFSDTSAIRFAVMTAALAITIGLGYVRFVRGRTDAGAPGMTATPTGAGVAELEARVRDLERRLDDAASALGPKGQ